MSSTWNCPVCNEDVLGSLCPNHEDRDHLIASHVETLDELRLFEEILHKIDPELCTHVKNAVKERLK